MFGERLGRGAARAAVDLFERPHEPNAVSAPPQVLGRRLAVQSVLGSDTGDVDPQRVVISGAQGEQRCLASASIRCLSAPGSRPSANLRSASAWATRAATSEIVPCVNLAGF